MSAKLRVEQLRDALAKRGLETSGLKAALVARLDEAVSAENKGSDDGDVESEQISAKKNEKVAGKKAHARDEADDEPPSKHAKMDDVNNMGVAELKAALADLGCSSSGNKNTLKKRLVAALESKASPTPANPDDGGSSSEEKNIVKATKKGRAVLDQYLPTDVQTNCRVIERGEEVYDAMLNQTNVEGNNNKFYVIQALEDEKKASSYYFFTRWGRVGSKGESNIKMFSCLNDVIEQFEKQFYAKTKNHWAGRHNFTSYKGKYTLLEMDYDAEEKQAELTPVKTMPKAIRATSKLDGPVAKLISLICNISMMQQQMVEIGYDARKMPLGKLSKSTILKGFDVLKRIANALESNKRSDLSQLSSEFYTVIPHDFGRQKMKNFVINTFQALKAKLEMVEALGEIELATNILGNLNEDEMEDPAFYHYQRLKCAIEPVVMDSDEANWVKAYVKNTHGHTHSSYSLEVQEIFKVSRENEDARYQAFAGTKNRMLLWHGSRLCNWTGILSQGLRIAPPEAPVTGYMFGKGVYFADMVSKSANYCYTSKREPLGILLLCEVALGEMNELLEADYNADKLPPGKLSTKGVGITAPDPEQFRILPDGLVVPMGQPKAEQISGASLQYNEYIVYKTEQIRMQYLLVVHFNYR